MALATDFNPGSAFCDSLPVVMTLACTALGMTPGEALAGVTRNAARALGFADRGTLAQGMRADIALWDLAEPAELAYRIGCDACTAVFRAGRLVRGTP